MIKLPRPRRIDLESGATLLYQGNPLSRSTAFGLWISRGSRDEGDGERGFSHALEHMVFRGTGRRSAMDIALELESIGGQWDAYTGKESTCYHGRALEEHFGTLVDIFSDMTLAPSIEARPLRTELRVIREEIRSIEDSPEDAVFELFYRTLFAGTQLGHPVAGTLGDISRIGREALLDFHRRTYTARNAVLGFIGNIGPGKAARVIEGSFDFARKGRKRKHPGETFGRARSRTLRREDWAQSHVCIGSRTVSASDPARLPVLLLSGILGGGVSSRLFQRLREETGLAYSVFSHVNFWRDTGALSVYFSVDPRNLARALDIFYSTVRELERDGIEPRELESSREQIKGSIVFNLENVETRLLKLFHDEFHHGRYLHAPSMLAALDRVTAEDVTEAARTFFNPDGLTRIVCGPRRGGTGR